MQNRWGDILKRATALLYLAGTASLLVGILLALATRPAEATPLDGQKASATAGSEGAQPVIPTLACATHNSDGTFTAIFGYDNQNSDAVSIPIGENNHVSPAPQDRGQPSEFKPGSVRDAFRVNFTEDQKITWSLTGPDGKTRSVTASDSTPHCKSEAPTATPTATRESEPPTATATREMEQPTATNTAVEADTATPTTESGGSPTDTPQPTVPVQATQAPSATPRPTRTPTNTALPPNPPTATNTPTNASNPPNATSTPTRTPLPQRSATATSTLLPTLPPPTPATSVTPALIPVTGADETSSLPGQSGALSLVELGFGLLGLGAVVHGLRLKLDEW
jgi:hypothetical protein